MNLSTEEWNPISTRIVISALAGHQIASDMNLPIQGWSPINASIVISVSVGHQIAQSMNVPTQERNLISVNTVKSALYHHQLASDMNLHTRMKPYHCKYLVYCVNCYSWSSNFYPLWLEEKEAFKFAAKKVRDICMKVSNCWWHELIHTGMRLYQCMNYEKYFK